MRPRPAALLVAILVLTVCRADAAPAQQPSAWEAQVLEALRTPPDHPRRVMLVFPLVEAGSKDGTIGWGRGLIALQAMWRSSFAPDRLLATCDFFMPSMFVDQQMIGPGRSVTAKKIENTCATFECPNYTTGALAIDDAYYKAELTFHGEHGERRKIYIGPTDQINMLPCYIARDVVDYLGVQLTPEQHAALTEPTLTSTEQLDRIADGYLYMSENMFWSPQNRISLVGEGRTQWTEDFILWEPPYDQAAFDRKIRQLPGTKDRLLVRYFRALAVWRNARDWQARASTMKPGVQPPDPKAVRDAWEQAASQFVPLLKEDPYNPWLLGLTARALGNAGFEQLHQAACERYKLVFGDGLLARMHRGTMLVDEAWDARGSGFVGTVTDVGWQRFGGLLAEAAPDLDEAADLEPRAWPVQGELIWLATSLGRSRADAEAAWRAAMDACPTDYSACWNLLWYLQPRWHGTARSVLDEARRIAAKGDPQACIPRLLPETYWILTQGPTEDADRYAGQRELLPEPDVAAQVIAALERCLAANPYDYTSRTMLVAAAYWGKDRDRVAKLAAAIGRPAPDEAPATLDQRYVTWWLYAEILDWLDHPDVSPLMAAARGGWTEDLKKLLADKADVNKAREDGATPLLLAAHFGHTDAVRALIGAGANPNVQDQAGYTPLLYLAEQNQTKLVTLLLDHKADSNVRNQSGFTALHTACRWWDRGAIAEELLQHGADTSILNKQGWAPLHLAAMNGNEAQVRSLLAHGADPDIASANGAEAPLQLAARGGYLDVVKSLTEAGADVNRRSANGSTPLHEAIAARRQDVAQWLLAHGAKANPPGSQHVTPLVQAVTGGQTDAAKELLAGGASPNEADDAGLTPLHRCADLPVDQADAARAIARLLLDAGAKVDAQAADGRTALFCAAQGGRLALARALVDAGANVNLPNKYGQSPLAICRDAPSDGVEIAALLIEHGADVKAQDSSQMTALHWAALLGNLRMADLLVQHGADLEARQDLQRTPLFMAVAGNHADMVSLLAGKGARVNTADKWDLTPLHVAASNGNPDIVAALLAHGADPNALNNDKLTPADLAERNGHPELVRLLRKAPSTPPPAAGG